MALCLPRLGIEAFKFRFHIFVGKRDSSIDQASNLMNLVSREDHNDTHCTHFEIWFISFCRTLKCKGIQRSLVCFSNIYAIAFSQSLGHNANHGFLGCRNILLERQKISFRSKCLKETKTNTPRIAIHPPFASVR